MLSGRGAQRVARRDPPGRDASAGGSVGGRQPAAGRARRGVLVSSPRRGGGGGGRMPGGGSPARRRGGRARAGGGAWRRPRGLGGPPEASMAGDTRASAPAGSASHQPSQPTAVGAKREAWRQRVGGGACAWRTRRQGGRGGGGGRRRRQGWRQRPCPRRAPSCSCRGGCGAWPATAPSPRHAGGGAT
ncbi:hypothetical protein BU14_0081s0019 [Porphyra umbilicalis]|uniref:Uncharacterized protein n=1 Tax=Porphyra umbilicalis TaxID=2786 RepID=A0A1X6PES4_PORUM|nr:hypothetical protein BU14_0081s0019 [Porphyra umbilicalis]|eukprot:OSX79340.1 hypothetical protein BU14_0081s0019 [Porphyra umbilicalis]